MNLSLPTKTIISALAIIVSFVFTNGAQAGRPLIHSESECREVAKYYGKAWGGSGNYGTKGCYYYENGQYGGKAYYGTGGVLWNQNANTGDGAKWSGKRRFDQICHVDVIVRMTSNDANPRGNGSKWPLLFHIECDCGNKEGEGGWLQANTRARTCAVNR